MKISRRRLWVMSWFTFTRRERNGILTLSFLVLIVQSVLIVRYFIIESPGSVPLNSSESLVISKLEKNDSLMHHFTGVRLKKKLNKPISEIDPNALSKADWIKFGLSDAQAQVVINCKQRGMKFRSKEDLAKMKFIPPNVYQNLESSLVFPQESRPERIQKKLEIIELNTADTIRLMELPLIGAGRARAIWKYRERLGGFYSLQQLNEIRLLPDSVIRVILPRVRIDTIFIRKIDINQISDSLSHPYFSRKLLKMIVSFRNQKGPFSETISIMELPLVDEGIWRKIAPYLTIAPNK